MSGAGEWRRWPALLVFMGAVLPFLPALRNGFVYWDDEFWLLEHPWHQAALWTRLGSSWSTAFINAYMPVTLTTFALDRALWGVEPQGYHLTNLLLHGATALAVYVLARHLIAAALAREARVRRPAIEIGAALAALVFAVHPLRAEPVAWVSARDTVLGGLLLVLATVAYLEGWQRGRARGAVKPSWLWVSLVLFAFSLLARSTGLVLPGVLVLLDIYPLRRLGRVGGWTGPGARRVWLEKVPFAALAVAVVPITLWMRVGGLMPPVGERWSPVHAGATAAYTAGWSLAALLAPVDLGPLYDMPTRARPFGYLAAAVGVAILTILVILGRNRWPSAVVAWAAFGLVLLPVSGAISGGVIPGLQDRYTYLPGVVAGILAGGGAALAWARRVNAQWSSASTVASLAVLAVLATWGTLAWRQCGVWRDSLTLWSHGVEVAPRHVLAHHTYGRVLERGGDLEGALRQYREITRLRPTSVRAQAQVGDTLLALGRLSEAETVLRGAAEAAPQDSGVRLGLGRVLAARGVVPEALDQLHRALQFDPHSPEAHLVLGQTLAQANRADEAKEHVRQALALRPGWKAAETLRAALDNGASGVPPTAPRP